MALSLYKHHFLINNTGGPAGTSINQKGSRQMGFLSNLLAAVVKETFGVGKSRFGNRSFNYTRGHSRKTDTYGYRGVFGNDVREVSGTCNKCNGSGVLNLECKNC